MVLRIILTSLCFAFALYAFEFLVAEIWHLYKRLLLCWEGLGAGGEGTTEDEVAGWHHRLDGRESE